MKKIIENYTDRISQQYPQYSDYTAHYSKLITELLLCDYNDFPSENKSMQYVKSILKEIITFAFTNVGIKNYLKMIIGIFDVPEVKSFYSSTNINTKQLYNMIDCVKYRVTYWQGHEGYPEKHLKYLLEPLI